MSQCDTCAFRAGCVTWHEPYNRLRAEIAALGLNPFLCHHGLDYTRIMGVKNGIAFDTAGNSTRAHVCDGWKARVKELAAKGRFSDPETRKLMRLIAARALKEIDLAIAADGELKEDHWEQVRTLVALLAEDVEVPALAFGASVKL